MGSSADAVEWSTPGLGDLRSRVAATLAANSVLWRLLPDGLGRLVATGTEVLLDGLLGALIAVSVTVRVADVRLLGVAFELALYFYVVHTVVPGLLPDDPPASEVLGTERFRFGASVFVLLLGFPLAASLPVLFSRSALEILAARAGLGVPTDAAGVAFVAAAVGASFLAWAGVATYTYLTWWRDATADERVTFFAQTSPRTVGRAKREQAREDLAQDGLTGTVTRAIAVLASTGLLPASLFMLGLLAALMVMLFPLPEAVVVAGALAGVLPGVGRLPFRAVDLEDRLLAVLRYVTASRRGMLLVPFLVAGFAVSILLTLVSNVGVVFLAYTVARQPGAVLRAATASPLALWGLLGVLVCATVPGFFSLWFWVRETVRLPHYLQHWEASRPGGAEVEAMTDIPANVTRPHGNLLAPSIMFLPLGGLLAASRGGDASPVALAAFGVAWPAATAVVAWAVYRTYAGDHQHPRTDGHAVLAASLLQLCWLWLLVGGAIVPGYDGPFTLRSLIVVSGFSVVLYVYADLELYLEYVAGRDARAYLAFNGGLGEYSAAVGASVLGVAMLCLAGLSLALGPHATLVPLTLGLFAGLMLALGGLGWGLAAAGDDG